MSPTILLGRKHNSGQDLDQGASTQFLSQTHPEEVGSSLVAKQQDVRLVVHPFFGYREFIGIIYFLFFVIYFGYDNSHLLPVSTRAACSKLVASGAANSNRGRHLHHPWTLLSSAVLSELLAARGWPTGF